MHHATTLPVPERTCSREGCATLFVSLELSRSTWVATALAPGSRKMSKHTLVGGDGRKTARRSSPGSVNWCQRHGRDVVSDRPA